LKEFEGQKRDNVTCV